MLNPFPDLLNYSFFAPLILRLVAGLIFIDLGILVFKSEKENWFNFLNILKIPKPMLTVKTLRVIEILGGIALILGYRIQITTLILALLTFVETYIEYKEPVILKRNFIFYIMLLGILLSLLLSGAGAFAFDLPL